MYAFQLTGPKQYRHIEMDRPIPQENELLIRVHRVGICGTDVEMLHGTMPYFKLGWAKYPVVLGHEWSGTVDQIGSAVEKFKINDRVTGDVSLGCGHCVNCMAGLYNLCVIKQEVGLCRGKNGAFAQYITMPDKHCYMVPESVSLDDAALTEPTATVIRAIRKVGFVPGATVYIAGDGPIGLLAMQAARVYGAGWIVLGGTSDAKLNLAKKLGADVSFNVVQQNLETFILDHTHGLGVDYTIEASGNAKALQQCLAVTRQGGRVSVVGVYDQPISHLDMGLAVVKDLDLCCSVASPNAFEPTLRLMASGRIQVTPLVTDVMSLHEAPKAFELQESASSHRIKIHLQHEPN